jgi:hypothetical protein
VSGSGDDVATEPCRFLERGCTAPAVVRVAMDQGCVCYPADREQWLCAQHEHRSEPLGSWEVLLEVSDDR